MIEDQISIQHKLQIFLGKDSLSQEILAQTKEKLLIIYFMFRKDLQSNPNFLDNLTFASNMYVG